MSLALDRSELMTANRDPGFYWVKRWRDESQGGPQWCIGYWRGRDYWEFPYDEGDFPIIDFQSTTKPTSGQPAGQVQLIPKSLCWLDWAGNWVPAYYDNWFYTDPISGFPVDSDPEVVPIPQPTN